MCALLAVVLGPVLLESVPLDSLRVVIGFLLLLFGLEWLRKGTLRLAGRRARSSSVAEFAETQEELEDVPLPPPGQADWPGRIVAFKGVLLEGVEVVIIVAALASRPSGPAPALWGRASPASPSSPPARGCANRSRASRRPNSKWGVGVLLSSFGVFFLAEGLHVEWPGGDAAVLYLVATLAAVSQLQIHRLARA